MCPHRILPRRLSIEQLEGRRLLALNPTADEQELLQLINRFRTNPSGEFSRLFSSVSPLTARNSSLQQDLDFFKVNGSMLQSEFAALTPAAPLTWNEAVNNFSAQHNSNMNSQNRLFHTDSVERRNALISAGVPLDVSSGQRITSELVFGRIRSTLHNFAGYAVNWGTGSGGMEATRSHRTAIMNPVFEEIGTKTTNSSASNLTPKVNTIVLANIHNAPVRVSGAVFEDRNKSGWYDAGEGIGDANLAFEHVDGQRFSARSLPTGGYQIELPSGVYKVRVTGGGLAHAITRVVTVGEQSLWQNFIYSPEDPAPDANEPNDTLATATTISASNAAVTGMSLHLTSDIDLFKYTATASGTARFELAFSHASGNIDMQLLDSRGAVLASSTSQGNGELITRQVTRDTTYYVRVYGTANPSYTLNVQGPTLVPPVALRDQAVLTSDSPTRALNILANDSDPDGATSELTPSFVATPPAWVVLNANKTVTATAPGGFDGLMRVPYRVTDRDGLTSSPANIDFFVINFERNFPWHNHDRPTDVNDDGVLTPTDALLIINFLSQGMDRILPRSGSTNIFGFLDVRADGRVTAADALQVINQLGRNAAGEGENSPRNHDAAISELVFGNQLVDEELLKRKQQFD